MECESIFRNLKLIVSETRVLTEESLVYLYMIGNRRPELLHGMDLAKFANNFLEK